MSLPLVPTVVLAALFSLAIITDLLDRRIPNLLIVSGFALAMFWQALGQPGAWAFDPAAPGAVGMLGGTMAAAVLLVGLVPLWLAGFIGAGDVKLVSVTGAVIGVSPGAWSHLAGLVLAMMLAGGVLAVARMALAGNPVAVIRNMASMWRDVRVVRQRTADRMPFALAIALGTVMYVGAKWFGWIRIF
jgi:prepilin peptidase CpaA